MNTRLKPTWLLVRDAPSKFTVEVTNYGIEDGKYGESDFVEGLVEGIPRKIRLNQKSILYLAEHKIAPDEKNFKKMLPGRKLIFVKEKLGAYEALVVQGIVAERRSKT